MLYLELYQFELLRKGCPAEARRPWKWFIEAMNVKNFIQVQ